MISGRKGWFAYSSLLQQRGQRSFSVLSVGLCFRLRTEWFEDSLSTCRRLCWQKKKKHAWQWIATQCASRLFPEGLDEVATQTWKFTKSVESWPAGCWRPWRSWMESETCDMLDVCYVTEVSFVFIACFQFPQIFCHRGEKALLTACLRTLRFSLCQKKVQIILFDLINGSQMHQQNISENGSRCKESYKSCDDISQALLFN